MTHATQSSPHPLAQMSRSSGKPLIIVWLQERAACLEENVMNTVSGGHHRSADAEQAGDQDSGLSEMNSDPGWGSEQLRADKDFSEILHSIFLLPK